MLIQKQYSNLIYKKIYNEMKMQQYFLLLKKQ